MRQLLIMLLVCLCAGIPCTLTAGHVALPATEGDALTEVTADPSRGFNFGYLVFVPKSAQSNNYSYLLVEPNNTGRPDDDLDVHRTAAIALARDSSVGNFVAKALGIPLLVPIFPRPSSAEDVYAHSLDRDTVLISEGPMRRLDLQLLAMIKDADQRLAATGHSVSRKVLINGFSASGLFANRFAFLHPEDVAAAAFGGVNGFIMLPVTKLKDRALEFPLGIADIEKITGRAFDRAAYNAIPQFAYMGADDTNDAVLHDDAYSEQERATIFECVGEKMMPDRWNAVAAVYRNENTKVTFKTYPGIPHGTNRTINSEVAEFFRDVMTSADPRQ